jgi:hypothetical protein
LPSVIKGDRARRTYVSDSIPEDYTCDHRNQLIKHAVDADGVGSGAAADQFFAGFEGMNPTLIFDGPNSGI